MKKTPLLPKILLTVLLLIGLSPCVWSSGYNNSNYKVGDDWKDGTISDRGFSDSASMIGSGFAPEMKLDDVRDLRKYFLKGYLEITPENTEGLLQYSDMYESAFKAYDRGVYVKRWKTSLDTEKLSDLLLAFTNIRQFKVEMIWDRENVDISDTISRSVQFFGDLGELTISRCQLTDRGLEDILESLKNPDTLKILDIRENRLSNSILPKIKERLIRLIDLKTDLVQTESKNLSVKESDSDRIAEELKAERLAAEQRTAEVEKQRLEEANRYADERKQQEAQERAKKLEKAQPAPTAIIERPIQKVLSIPERRQLAVSRPINNSMPAIARGYEAIYQRFINGKLIYKPDPNSDAGKREFPFSQFANTLEGEINLSGLTFKDYYDNNKIKDVDDFLRIKLGYRKVKENDEKTTVWIVPKFVVEDSLNNRTVGGLFSNITGKKSVAEHYRSIMSNWSSEIGIFWTWGNHDLAWCDHVLNKHVDKILSKNLDVMYCEWAGVTGGIGNKAPLAIFFLQF